MFSLLMYFVRNDKNKDDQSIIIQYVYMIEHWVTISPDNAYVF